MIGKVILMIMLSHSSASHLNSGGEQISFSYLQFNDMAACRLSGPVFAEAQQRMANKMRSTRYTNEFSVTWECL